MSKVRQVNTLYDKRLSKPTEMHHTSRAQPTDIDTQAAAAIDGSDPLGPKVDTSGDGLAQGSPGASGG